MSDFSGWSEWMRCVLFFWLGAQFGFLGGLWFWSWINRHKLEFYIQFHGEEEGS